MRRTEDVFSVRLLKDNAILLAGYAVFRRLTMITISKPITMTAPMIPPIIAQLTPDGGGTVLVVTGVVVTVAVGDVTVDGGVWVGVTVGVAGVVVGVCVGVTVGLVVVVVVGVTVVVGVGVVVAAGSGAIRAYWPK